jgi:hypothetical protein
MELEKRLFILPQRAERIINQFANNNNIINQMINQSFLNDELKKMYLSNVEDRLMRLALK